MIPKKIHYCWLGDAEMPKRLRRYMATWQRVLPDYEIVKWDAARFHIDAHPFVAEAVRARKWAFASDYIRLHALYTEGGIYLDTDVGVKKPLDEFRAHRFFSAVEYHPGLPPAIGVLSALMGSEAGHPFLKDCLNFYKDRHFDLGNGEFFMSPIAPAIYAGVAENYGFRYENERQILREDMLITSSEIFATTEKLATRKAFAIHYGEGSWRDRNPLDAVRAKLRTRHPDLYNVARAVARSWRR